MYIKFGYDIIFDLPAPTTMLLALLVSPEKAHVLQRPERVIVDPPMPVHTFLDHYGNRIGRLDVPAGRVRLYYDNVAADSGEPEPGIEGTILHRPEELPDECLPFLLASRYCESDRLSDLAWNLFGQTPETWERVRAIVDWAHGQIEFGYPYARPTKTAFEACNERQGVCRDYTHLAIALLRAMNIPARYATGYLGTMGEPPRTTPMDFSAFAEVYLSGRWWAVDARFNKQRIGRIKQAHGHDAADVALTTCFGPANLEKFLVWTEEM